MAKHLLILILLFISLFHCDLTFSQSKPIKLGTSAKNNKFTTLDEATRALTSHRFIPRGSEAYAYDLSGRKFLLHKDTPIRADFILGGSWDGKTGQWILFYDWNHSVNGKSECFVFLDDMVDVEQQLAKADQVNLENKFQAKIDGLQSDFMRYVFPLLLIIGLYIIGNKTIRSYTRRCRKCGKWNTREIVHRISLGGGPYTYTGYQTATGYTSKGEPVSVNVPVTKTGNSNNYLYTYRCNKCGHKWNSK